MIDHAPREPAEPDFDTIPAHPPGPTGGGFDLEALVHEAVLESRGQDDGFFDVAAFSAAVTARFDLRKQPDYRWCEKVLGGLPYVTPVGMLGRWKYLAT